MALNVSLTIALDKEEPISLFLPKKLLEMLPDLPWIWKEKTRWPQMRQVKLVELASVDDLPFLLQVEGACLIVGLSVLCQDELVYGYFLGLAKQRPSFVFLDLPSPWSSYYYTPIEVDTKGCIKGRMMEEMDQRDWRIKNKILLN